MEWGSTMQIWPEGVRRQSEAAFFKSQTTRVERLYMRDHGIVDQKFVNDFLVPWQVYQEFSEGQTVQYVYKKEQKRKTTIRNEQRKKINRV